MLTGFTKYVPTDMNWHGNYEGGYVSVRFHSFGDLFYVSIWGTDDTTCSLRFTDLGQALACFNRVNYIQSSRDLVDFLDSDNNNGWPTERPSLDGRFVWPPSTEPNEVWDNEAPLPIPWGRDGNDYH